MTEFFKNNQIALRHCLLYEFLQGKCAEKAFVDFSRTIRKHVMKKEEVQIWFRRFAKGKFYKNCKKHDQVTAKNMYQSDKKALRTCILYLSLKSQKKTKKNPYLLNSMDPDKIPNSWCKEDNLIRFNPSFVMYEEFRKVIGEDVMEYKEFDFWFHRFLNGEFDLNIEKDENKKIYELADMPIDILENIVEHLNIFDRINLAKTSRSFRTFTKDQKLSFRCVELDAYDHFARISIENEIMIEYGAKRDDYIKIVISSKKYDYIFRKSEKFIKGVPRWKQALMDFKNILEISKLKMDLLRISWGVDETFYQPPAIHDSETSWAFTHQLNVKKFCIHCRSLEPLLTILPSLKPGYLTTIEMYVSEPEPYPLEELVGMEQWKQAKHFVISGPFPNGLLHHLYHFKEFTVCLNELAVEDIREMKENLFKSSDFDKCTISVYSLDMAAIRHEFGEPIQGYPDTYHYPILNSTECFEIWTQRWEISIEKIKK